MATSFVHKPPWPIWKERSGRTYTVCSVCHRLWEALPPVTCDDCLEVAKVKRREQRAARKLKAVT